MRLDGNLRINVTPLVHVFCLVGLAWVIFGERQLVRGAEPDAAAVEFFEQKIRPIFVTHCSECHGRKKHGGLLLDSREGWMTGGDSGPAIVPGDLRLRQLLFRRHLQIFVDLPHGANQQALVDITRNYGRA